MVNQETEESNRRKYQKLLDQFLLLQKRENSGVTSGRDEEDEDEEEKKRKSEEAKIAAAKAKAVKVANTKAEERHKKMRTKIRAMHPKPVKKFACGNESAMMLLQNGELYQWRDDNPLPVLMNHMFDKDFDPNSMVAKLNTSRFYWTEEELLSLDRQAIETLMIEMKVVIHHRGSYCAYYRHDYESV